MGSSRSARKKSASSSPERIRPGGRSERVGRARGACLSRLLVEEIELAPAVRDRGSAGRPYRWWPTRTDLLRNALAFHTRRLSRPYGSWAGDVRALVARAAFLADPVERAQNAILASGLYPDFNRVMLEYYEPIQAGARSSSGPRAARSRTTSTPTS